MLHKEPDGSYKIPRITYADAYGVLAALSVAAGVLAKR